jgi:hypothetical protein
MNDYYLCFLLFFLIFFTLIFLNKKINIILKLCDLFEYKIEKLIRLNNSFFEI